MENPFYAAAKPEQWTQGKPVKCKFDGLVSIAEFNQANRSKVVITEKDDEIAIFRRQPPEFQPKKGVKNPEYPYKRVILCPHREKPLLDSASRGRHGGYFSAYHCYKPGHRFRIKKADFDKTPTEFVQSILIASEYVEALTGSMLTVWERR